MSKVYQATKSEWPVETGYIDRVQRSVVGPLVSAEGDGSPLDAPLMLLPGIYAIPPIGARVQFQHSEEGTHAGLMLEWPEESISQIAARAALLPVYNPGDVLIVAAGSLLQNGAMQYIYFKADGSIKWNCLDAGGAPVTEITSNTDGVQIKTTQFSVTAEKISLTETG